MPLINTFGTPANLLFYTGTVSLSTATQGNVAGLLNPTNTDQAIWDCASAYQCASITTVVTGAPASTTVVLEGTLDGTNWFTVATSTNVGSSPVTNYGSAMQPFTSLRARCTAVSGGTSPTISVAAVAYQNPPPITSPDQILDGSATAANTASAQTILTVPAGRTWKGNLNLVMTNQAATGTLVSAAINTAGTNPTPAAAVNILSVQAGTGGTVAGDVTNTAYIDEVMVVAPAANSVTLTLTNSTATTCTSTANAVGVLL